jgi:hypothetical protein
MMEAAAAGDTEDKRRQIGGVKSTQAHYCTQSNKQTNSVQGQNGLVQGGHWQFTVDRYSKGVSGLAAIIRNVH